MRNDDKQRTSSAYVFSYFFFWGYFSAGYFTYEKPHMRFATMRHRPQEMDRQSIQQQNYQTAA